MKKATLPLTFLLVAMLIATSDGLTQMNVGNVVNVQQLRTKYVEGGSLAIRDSLVALYNDMVIKKNEYILSHREYRHLYTPSNTDYMVIEEYKDLASMEKANAMIDELEKKAWPDATQRKAFMDAMNAYFENWHGDALYSINAKLSKN